MFDRVDPYCDGAQLVSGAVESRKDASAEKARLNLLV